MLADPMNVGPEQHVRTWLYLRVSNDPTGRGLSVKSQEDELRAWAAREGWTIAGVTTDNDMSASRNKKARPGYLEVQRNMAAGKMDILACWESSRAQRDVEAYIQTRKLCEQHSVLYGYRGRVYDLSQTNDRFITILDAALDERYADEVRDRVNRGVQASLARNTARGKIPFGYQRIYDPGTGALTAQIPDPASAPIVRELFKRIAAGDGLYTIASDLNRRGVPTPQEHRDTRRGVSADRAGWTSSKIRRQVGNGQLAGFRMYKAEHYGETSWEPLVSAEQFALVRSILSNPQRRTQRGVAPKWLLSGILECGQCGAKCRRISNRGLPSYACHGRNYNNKACVCGRQEPIDDFVTEVLITRLARPDAAGLFQDKDSGEERTEAARELAELEAELEEYRLAAEDRRLSVETMVRVEARLLPRIEDAQRRCVPAWVPPAVHDLVGETHVESRWEELPLITKREVINAVMHVTLRKDRRPAGSRGFDVDRVQIDWRTGTG